MYLHYLSPLSCKSFCLSKKSLILELPLRLLPLSFMHMICSLDTVITSQDGESVG